MLLAITVLLVVAVAAGAIVLDNVDLNDHVERIKKELSAELGRPVRIMGKIDQDLLTFSPTLTVRQLEIGGPKWAPDRPTVTVARVDLAFDWINLLQGKLRISSIRLERPKVQLEINRKGEANWEFLSHEDPTGDQDDDPWLLIQKSSIDGGEVVFIDRRTREHHRILISRFDLRHASLKSPSDWQFSGSLNGMSVRLDARTAQFRRLISGVGAPASFTIEFGQSKLSAKLSALKLGKKLGAHGSVKIKKLDYKDLDRLSGGGSTAGARLPAGFLRYMDLDLKLTAERIDVGRLKPIRVKAHLFSVAQGLDIRRLQVRTPQATISGTVTLNPATGLRGNLAAAYAKKRIRVSGSVGSLVALAEGKWTTVRVRASDGKINLSTNVRFRWGQKGWGLTGSISSDRLSVGERSPRAKPGTGKGPLIPREIAAVLTKGTAQVQFRAKRVSIRGVNLNNLVLSAKLDRSILRIPRYSMTVLQGSFSGSLMASLGKSGVVLSGQTVIRSRAIGNIDKDLAKAIGPTDILLNSRYRSQGRTAKDLISNLGGQVSIIVTSTAKAAEVSLMDKLATGALGPVVIIASDRGGKLRCVVGQMVFVRGIGRTRDLLIETAKITYRGEGIFNLRNQHVSAVIVPIGKGLLRGRIRPFAIRVSGPLRRPRVRLAVGRAAIQTLKSVAGTTKAPVKVLRRLLGGQGPLPVVQSTCQKAIAKLKSPAK